MPYQTFEHTADLGISIQAGSVKVLFEEAARALSEQIFGKCVFAATEEISVSVRGNDWPDLMVNWLRELLYLWNGKRWIPGPVDIMRIEPFKLEATVPVDSRPGTSHDSVREIKAVTYHQIEVGRLDHGWQARVIFDV